MYGSKEDVDKAVSIIEKENEANQTTDNDSMTAWQLLTTPSLGLQNFVNVMMHFIPPVSGISAIYAYSTRFFQRGGVPCDFSQYGSVGIGATMIVITLPIVPLMEAVGRRILFILGICGMLISSVVITIVLNVSDLQESTCGSSATGPVSQIPSETNIAGYILVASTIMFVVSFSIGPGPIPWIATGEMFCQKARGAAMAVGTFFRWSGSLLIVVVFNQFQQRFKEMTFVPSIVLLSSLLLTIMFLFPETKNKDPSQVSESFKAKRPCGGVKKSLDICQDV